MNSEHARAIVQDYAAALKSIPGVLGVSLSYSGGIPRVRVMVRADARGQLAAQRLPYDIEGVPVTVVGVQEMEGLRLGQGNASG